MVNFESFTDKEVAILEAAMEVFTEKGFHGAKMQEIADRADINKAMLHYYFRNKERLYHQIFEMVFTNFVLSASVALKSDQPFKETLREFIHLFIDALKKDSRVPMFIANELGQGGKTVSKIVTNFVNNAPDTGPWKILKLIELGKASAEIDQDVDAKQFLLTLMGSCIYFFIAEPIINQLFAGDEKLDREGFLEHRKTALFNTLYYGIQNRRDG